MAKVTLVFAALFVALGLIGFIGTGSTHPTALIPVLLGVLLAVFAVLAIVTGRNKLFMHINVTLGLLGFLGTVKGLILWFGTLAGNAVANLPATQSKAAMALLSLIYVLLCVRSFINARVVGAGKQA